MSVLSLLWTVTGVAAKVADGGELFQKRCGTCHALPDPANPPAEGWEGRLKSMASLARLNTGQKDAVLEYLRDHSQTQSSEMALADDKLLFEQKCSQCHTTNRVFIEPLTDESLRHVISSMQEKGAEAGISEDSANRILNYLLTLELDGKAPEALPESAGAEELFAARCLACHSRERIAIHLEKNDLVGMDWTHVVTRMQAKAPQWITETEAKQIADYIESLHAPENGG